MSGNPFAGARIETSRVLLRPFEEADSSAFAAIASQDEVLEFLPSADRMTPGQLRGVFEWLLECYETNTLERIHKFTLPVVLKRTGEIVGWCGLGPLEFDQSEMELYFVISPEHWGEGLATEAAGALLSYAFDALGLPRVVAVVDPANHASVHVIRKLGMVPEGTVQGLGAAHQDYEGYSKYSVNAGNLPETAKTSN
jgi:ribosomal-protein-alanine N-acetyltransferase